MSNLLNSRSPLTYYERQIIEMRLRGKWRVRRIARHLNRDPSIISRELKRNCHPSGKYIASYAEEKAEKRTRRTNKKRLDKDFLLSLRVREKLKEGWSPEQIAGRLKTCPPKELSGVTIGHEAIYRYIYESPYGRYLYHYLRRKKTPKRQQRYARKPQKALILERISIALRPEVINLQTRIGDWESDTVRFSEQKACLSVQHERKSLLLRLHKVENRKAEATREALTATLESLPDNELFKSVTFDNGGENACHASIRDSCNINTYFCEPYKSWQKGGVENSNGLLRQYLPRRTDLTAVNEKDIYDLREKLNNRPRKKLGYLTPNEVIRQYMFQSKSVA